MKQKSIQKQTTVGTVDENVLAYTAGQDVQLDRALIEADCAGTAAHVMMLAKMPMKPPVITAEDTRKVVRELARIIEDAREGRFEITLADQDVHLAVERRLTERLGDLGKRVHTCRSRNDQVAVDLRLFAKEKLLNLMELTARLASEWIRFAKANEKIPMVGRTHMQPAMPSSVGLWASSWTEGLLDDFPLLMTAYELNDQSPLGAAASYGVPLPIDRQLTSDLLGFSKPIHNVLHANQMRGKLESIILSACAQVMLTLSQIAEDLILFSMPEFSYFRLPAEYTTGSSIMPQKRNPDVLELLRAKAAKVQTHAHFVAEVIRAAPTGYNRDLQETKAPFMEGLEITGNTLQVMTDLVPTIQVNTSALKKAFAPDVFATDQALAWVAEGMPFRDAYHRVKEHLDDLKTIDPMDAVALKRHLGASMGLDWHQYDHRIREALEWVKDERKNHRTHIQKLFSRTPLKKSNLI